MSGVHPDAHTLQSTPGILFILGVLDLDQCKEAPPAQPGLGKKQKPEFLALSSTHTSELFLL